MSSSRVLGELGQLAFWCCCWDPQRLVETLFLKQLSPSLVERPYKKLNTELYRRTCGFRRAFLLAMAKLENWGAWITVGNEHALDRGCQFGVL